MAFRKKNIYDLEDELYDLNRKNKKRLKDDLDDEEDEKAPKKYSLDPKDSMKAFFDSVARERNDRINKMEKEKKSEEFSLPPIDVESIESKLNFLARKNKEEDDKREKKKEKEEEKDKDKKGKKDKKKLRKELRYMFPSISGILDEEDEEEEISTKESNDDDSDKLRLTGRLPFKNKLVKDTEGTSLDTPLGMRFSTVYAKQVEEVEYLGEIIEDLKEDLKKSPTRNMYRSSQTSNLLSALGHRRALIKDMADVAKTISDLELKHAKEKRASKEEEKGNGASLISNFGAKLIRGFYDEDIKKYKKKDKKKKDTDDDDDDDAFEMPSRKVKDKLDGVAARNIILSPYERNLDIEGSFEIAVVADKEDPKSDWKFILMDKNGKRRKDWENERPGLMPHKKNVKMSFIVEKLKAVDNVTRKGYKLILK